MAVTYTKPLKTIVITTGKSQFTVADTVDCPYASNALAEFEAFGIMHVETSEGDNYEIPYHAVDNIQITVATSESITRNDPVCEE